MPLAIACALFLLGGQRVFAGINCKDTYNRTAPEEDGSTACTTCYFVYKKHWAVYFLDGYDRRIDPEAWGEVYHGFKCPPSFATPAFVDDGRGTGIWTQTSADGEFTSSSEGTLG